MLASKYYVRTVNKFILKRFTINNLQFESAAKKLARVMDDEM